MTKVIIPDKKTRNRLSRAQTFKVLKSCPAREAVYLLDRLESVSNAAQTLFKQASPRARTMALESMSPALKDLVKGK